jgi:pimeloyl-ACP methyl ester carboxylesterase
MPDTTTLTSPALPAVAHRYVDADGLRIFYREAGAFPGAPTLLLLHGFPSSSHQFKQLIHALRGRVRLIAPDYPGFGYSDAPPSSNAGGSFAYTFDALADAVEGFCSAHRSASGWPSAIPTGSPDS